jgi:hypothetical protein
MLKPRRRQIEILERFFPDPTGEPPVHRNARELEEANGALQT